LAQVGLRGCSPAGCEVVHLLVDWEVRVCRAIVKSEHAVLL
jgi:hypothetical protein